jgi:hypothetical protein
MIKKITKKTEIGQYIDDIIRESVKGVLQAKALEEKDKQNTSSPEPEPDQAEQSTNADSNVDSTNDEDKEALAGDVDLDQIIEKLNTIRSGKSFKDSLVQQRFNKYFEGLQDAEKVALFAFLKGIAQIVTGEVEPDEAIEPSDKPADVSMKKGPNVQKKSIKPNVIKTPEPEPERSNTKTKQPGSEDTSAPIQVKKR